MSARPNESDIWLLVFDGDCDFCRYTVEYARAVTDAGPPPFTVRKAESGLI